jgi:hypothetical protein
MFKQTFKLIANVLKFVYFCRSLFGNAKKTVSAFGKTLNLFVERSGRPPGLNFSTSGHRFMFSNVSEGRWQCNTEAVSKRLKVFQNIAGGAGECST